MEGRVVCCTSVFLWLIATVNKGTETSRMSEDWA